MSARDSEVLDCLPSGDLHRPLSAMSSARHRVPWLSGALLTLMLVSSPLRAADAINVAYFLEWPTPSLVAKADGAFEAALGVPVNWTAFDTGTQMTEAFLAGEIDLAYSQGLAPFIAAVNADTPISTVAVAVQYPANDCVLRSDAGIDATVPGSFTGRRAAVPLATMADYSFRLMLRALQVEPDAMLVIDRVPADAAVALVDGEVDMACGFGALAMSKMYEVGEPLMSERQKADAGIVSFDVISVDRRFARDNAELVRRFLDVTHAANDDWTGSAAQVAKVAAESGLDPTGVLAQMADFRFPSVAEQRRELFGLDGLAIEAMNTVGDAFASGTSPAREDYAVTIDARFLR